MKDESREIHQGAYKLEDDDRVEWPKGVQDGNVIKLEQHNRGS